MNEVESRLLGVLLQIILVNDNLQPLMHSFQHRLKQSVAGRMSFGIKLLHRDKFVETFYLQGSAHDFFLKSLFCEFFLDL